MLSKMAACWRDKEVFFATASLLLKLGKKNKEVFFATASLLRFKVKNTVSNLGQKQYKIVSFQSVNN